jgi:hypothetical protein
MKPAKNPRGKAADVRANLPTGKRGKNVRPLHGQPAIGKNYELGFRKPPEKSPWQDEGEPEVNG